MERRDGSPRRFKRRKRLIAFVLAIVLSGTMALSGLVAASRITISTEENLGNPAVNTLLQTTDYIKAGPGARIQEQINLLIGAATLADYYTLACSQIAREQFAKALVNIMKCIELYSAEVEEEGGNEVYLDIWLKKACLEVMLGEYDAALLSLEAVLEADDSVSSAHLVRAQIYAARQDMPAMSESLAAYLALVPWDEEMRSLLSQAILVQNQTNETQQFVEMKETPPEAVSPDEAAPDGDFLPEIGVEMQYLDGLYALQDGDYESAQQALTGAIEMNPDYEGLFYFRGICRLTLADYAGAAEDFTETIHRGYMVHMARYNLGIAKILSDAYDEGLVEIEAAAAMDDDPSVKAQAEEFLAQVAEIEAEAELMELLVKAQACNDQSDFLGMCDYLAQYLERAPDDSGIREVFAQGLFVSEQYPSAMEQYLALIAQMQNQTPDAPADTAKLGEYSYLYGLSAIQISDFEVALQTLSEVIDRYGGHEGAHYYRGICRLSLGLYQVAAEDFEQSIARGEMTHSCIYNRGICKLMLEDYDGGLADVTLAASMDDDPEVSQQASSLLAELEP